jgi:LPS-assembly protein
MSWRRTLIDRIGITYTPYANLRGDAYQINDYVDAVTGVRQENESFVRGIGTAGATVSYPWIASTSTASHTIEPIGQIVARTGTGVDQRHLPNEDAQSLVFDDTNLFEFDKFSGYDRIETGTRVNVGLQYTFQLNQGGYARLVAGQSFQISGTNPYTNPGFSRFDDPATPIRENERGMIVGDEALRSFNPNNGLESDRSDYVVGAYLAPTDAFRVIGQSRFDEDDFDMRRTDIFSSTTVGPVTFDASYAFTSALPESGLEKDDHELSGGIGFKLTEYWSVRGAVRYDLDDYFLLSDTIQVRYADECFVLQVSYTETEFRDDRGLAPDRTVFLRFAFKHLGQFDYRTDALDFVSGDQQPPDR